MITFNMIAENLETAEVLCMPNRKTRRFSRLYLLGDESDFAKDAEWIPGTLFFGTPQAVGPFLAQFRDQYAVCVQAESTVAPELLGCRDRAFACKTDKGAMAVYHEIERYFFAIETWTTRMKTVLLEGGGYQSLVNCSEEVLKNFLMVSNSEFRLLAYSQHTPINDPTTKLIIEQGVHPQQTVELFKKYQVTKDWKSQTKIELKPASELTVNPVLDYVFRIQGSYFIHVLMHCNIVPPSAGLVDTFQLLIDHLEYHVKHNWSERLLLDQEPSKLFNDLIARKPYGENALESRLRGIGVPKTGSFVLFAFMFISESSDDQLLLFYTHQLKEAFPWCHVGLHGSHVLALDPTGKLASSKSQLQSFVNAHPCTIGVSSAFSHLNEFAFAYRQAKSAIEIATSSKQSLASAYLDEQAATMCYFERSFASYVVGVASNNNQLVAHSVENGLVARIVAYDAQHGTEDARLLFFYLAYERKVSAACNALFLHRNTLLYHIEKLQERFSFDLDDFHTRQRIMFEYLLYPAP